jgi:CheY-like chemotaxis protein
MKISVDVTMPRMEGYEVLDYLYDHGADTVEGIAAFTGLSREQVVSDLLGFMNHGFVEETA